MKEGDLVYINFDKKDSYDNIETIGHIYQNMIGVIISVNFSTCSIDLSLNNKEKVMQHNKRSGQRWTVTPRIPQKFLFPKKLLLENE